MFKNFFAAVFGWKRKSTGIKYYCSGNNSSVFQEGFFLFLLVCKFSMNPVFDRPFAFKHMGIILNDLFSFFTMQNLLTFKYMSSASDDI